MPAGVGYPPPEQSQDPEAMLSGMSAMLEGGGGPQGAPPPMPGGEEGGGLEQQVIATLAEENAQLRALVGLGPEDPIPMPEQQDASTAAPGAQPVGP